MDTTLSIAFLAGLISFLSPCVLPLIPGYISYISGTSFNEIVKLTKDSSPNKLNIIMGTQIQWIFLLVAKKTLSATIEMLSLYIDLNQRKVAEFEDEKIKIMDEYIEKNKSNFKNENLKFSSKLKK